jgi:hypothetical protein
LDATELFGSQISGNPGAFFGQCSASSLRSLECAHHRIGNTVPMCERLRRRDAQLH